MIAIFLFKKWFLKYRVQKYEYVFYAFSLIIILFFYLPSVAQIPYKTTIFASPGLSTSIGIVASLSYGINLNRSDFTFPFSAFNDIDCSTPFYRFISAITKQTNSLPTTTVKLFLITFLAVFVVLLYRVSKQFSKSEIFSYISFILILFSGGFGWENALLKENRDDKLVDFVFITDHNNDRRNYFKQPFQQDILVNPDTLFCSCIFLSVATILIDINPMFLFIISLPLGIKAQRREQPLFTLIKDIGLIAVGCIPYKMGLVSAFSLLIYIFYEVDMQYITVFLTIPAIIQITTIYTTVSRWLSKNATLLGVWDCIFLFSCLAMCISGILSLYRGFHIEEGISWQGIQIGKVIRTETPSDAIFLTPESAFDPALHIAGRRVWVTNSRQLALFNIKSNDDAKMRSLLLRNPQIVDGWLNISADYVLQIKRNGRSNWHHFEWLSKVAENDQYAIWHISRQ